MFIPNDYSTAYTMIVERGTQDEMFTVTLYNVATQLAEHHAEYGYAWLTRFARPFNIVKIVTRVSGGDDTLANRMLKAFAVQKSANYSDMTGQYIQRGGQQQSTEDTTMRYGIGNIHSDTRIGPFSSEDLAVQYMIDNDLSFDDGWIIVEWAQQKLLCSLKDTTMTRTIIANAVNTLVSIIGMLFMVMALFAATVDSMAHMPPIGMQLSIFTDSVTFILSTLVSIVC